MRLLAISAAPHPDGNRIDLSWELPPGALGVRVVRREQTYPRGPDDGALVAEGDGLSAASDRGLRAETVYYYTLFPYAARPPTYHAERENCAVAMATGPYDSAGQMERLLPEIYRRYDHRDGRLRRLLILVGGQLDQLHSFATALLDVTDPHRVDARLLPLLADWVGWQADQRLDVAEQRNEVRQAPYIYRTLGTIPSVEATIKRLIGWESRVKEFSSNILRANEPERLNLWLRRRDPSGRWDTPAAPLSLDFAYLGRASAIPGQGGEPLVFYHTLRQGQWQIWQKARSGDVWQPSAPVPIAAGPNCQRPTAAALGGRRWLFWERYDEQVHRWRIDLGVQGEAEAWLEARQAGVGMPWASDDVERRSPTAAAAGERLWLFWRQRADTGWQIWQSSFADGVGWGEPAPLPPGDADVERPTDDLFALADQGGSIWLFWAEQWLVDGAPPRWRVAHRVMAQSAGAAEGAWGPACQLAAPPDADEREPTAALGPGGLIELAWASRRDGGWSIWRSAQAGEGFGPGERLTDSAYTQRAPLLIADGAALLLLYRANDSVSYPSPTYSATRTVDTRYAGSTSVDTTNRARLGLRGRYEDFQAYTYDTGRGDESWYAWDTVGIYLVPSTDNQGQIERDQRLIETVLRRFLPIGVRVVFIIETVYRDYIYTYEGPQAGARQLIGEAYQDALLSQAAEIYNGPGEARAASAPGWRLLRAWAPGANAAGSIDTRGMAPDTTTRTWHSEISTGA